MVRRSTREKKPVIPKVPPKPVGSKSKPSTSRSKVKKPESPVTRVISHHIYNTHYTAYTMEREDGTTLEGTEFDLKDYMNLIDKYREELTGQANSGDGDFEIDRIVAHRYVTLAGSVEPLYLVQWKGYPHPVWYSEMWEDEIKQNRKLFEVYEKNPFETK